VEFIRSLFYLILPSTKKWLMRTFLIVAILFSSLIYLSCGSTKAEQKKVELTPEQLIQKKLDSLKLIAQPGDMLARMNDNILSYHVRNFNPTDKSFSHGGIVVLRQGQKMVCSIDANEKGLDTVRYDVIDSFLNPKQNFLCGLFRFDITETEKENFLKELDAFHDKNVHFDKRYDLATDSLIYCSELIAKSLGKATNGRLKFEETNTPKMMIPLMTKYFKLDAPKNISAKTVQKIITERKYIPIDALYLNENCQELMRFKLKHFPGE
jgi:hypothetical protein